MRILAVFGYWNPMRFIPDFCLIKSLCSLVLIQAVRHSNAVLTYAPTYLPKEGICARYIDYSIKFRRDPFASRFTKATAQPADCVLPSAPAQYVTYGVPMKPANYFSGG